MGDFEISTSEDWLSRRRSQIATACRKMRLKKKQEEEELRSENLQLRDERRELLSKIEGLERQIHDGDQGEGHGDELENELLRYQILQHENFIKAFLVQIETLVSCETYSRVFLRVPACS